MKPPVSSLLALPWKALGSFRLLEEPGLGDSWIPHFFQRTGGSMIRKSFQKK